MMLWSSCFLFIRETRGNQIFTKVEKLKIRKRNEIEVEGEDGYMEYFDNEGEEDLHVMCLEDEDRVVEATSNFAAKHITFTEQDKTDILNLFKIVLEVARERIP